MPLQGMPACFVGLDAGGSRSRAVLTDTHLTPIHVREGPNANPSCLSVEVAAARLARLVEAVRRPQGPGNPRPVSLLACSVAGAGRRSVKEGLEAALARRLPDVARVQVTGDVEALLFSMLAEPDPAGPAGQVALIAGTGSVALGQNARGERARSGGEGWPRGDLGSGAWIGRQALILAEQGRADPRCTTRLSAMLPAFAPDGPGSPARDLAALVPAVARAAGEGDQVAAELLCEAGRELARMALAVILRLSLETLSFPLALGGGLFRAGPLIEASLSDTIRAGAPGARIFMPADPPEVGVLRHALRERTESP